MANKDWSLTKKSKLLIMNLKQFFSFNFLVSFCGEACFLGSSLGFGLQFRSWRRRAVSSSSNRINYTSPRGDTGLDSAAADFELELTAQAADDRFLLSFQLFCLLGGGQRYLYRERKERGGQRTAGPGAKSFPFLSAVILLLSVSRLLAAWAGQSAEL